MKKILIFLAVLLLSVGAVSAAATFRYDAINFKTSPYGVEVQLKNKDSTYAKIPVIYNPAAGKFLLAFDNDAVPGICEEIILREGESCKGSTLDQMDIERTGLFVVKKDGSIHLLQITDFEAENGFVVADFRDITSGKRYADKKSVIQADGTITFSLERSLPAIILQYDTASNTLKAISLLHPKVNEVAPYIRLSGRKGSVQFYNNEKIEVNVPFVYSLLEEKAYFGTKDNKESCEGRMLFEGKYCESSTLEDAEGVYFYARTKKGTIHVLELTNINDGTVDVTDVTYGKNYADIVFNTEAGGALSVGDLGVIRVAISGGNGLPVEFRATDLLLRKR